MYDSLVQRWTVTISAKRGHFKQFILYTNLHSPLDSTWVLSLIYYNNIISKWLRLGKAKLQTSEIKKCCKQIKKEKRKKRITASKC